MNTAGHTQRPMSLEVRLAAGMQLFVAAAACLYWGAWYGGGRALIATQDSELYVGFQNACVFADLWLVSACVMGARALLTRRPSGVLWVLLASSSGVFLGLLDVAFNLQNGVYRSASGLPLAMEVCLNGLSLSFGLWGSRFAWRHRHLLTLAARNEGSRAAAD